MLAFFFVMIFSLVNLLIVWESESSAAEEERGRVRRGRGT
jgi:hypothetical protein